MLLIGRESFLSGHIVGRSYKRQVVVIINIAFGAEGGFNLTAVAQGAHGLHVKRSLT